MTGYVLRPYDPALLSHATQEGYQQEIHEQLASYEGYMTVQQQALLIALFLARQIEQEYGVGIFTQVTLSQFFLLIATLEQILDEVLFESEEEVEDGDGIFFTDLPKEDQDGLCALLLNMCLQTLWPAAFLLPSPPFGAGEEAVKEEGQSCCVCGLPAEGAEQVCACTCPECGTHTFDDLILSNRGRCWDCWKQWQMRPEQIAQEAEVWTTHRREGEEER